jgi:hypothetical protein
MLMKYSQLGHVWRTEPCQEYPGQWLLYWPGETGQQEESYPSFMEALNQGRKKIATLETLRQDFNACDVSICWKCSDNDPRIGEVWFTGFYQQGKFNAFGQYRDT